MWMTPSANLKVRGQGELVRICDFSLILQANTGNVGGQRSFWSSSKVTRVTGSLKVKVTKSAMSGLI